MCAFISPSVLFPCIEPFTVTLSHISRDVTPAPVTLRTYIQGMAYLSTWWQSGACLPFWIHRFSEAEVPESTRCQVFPVSFHQPRSSPPDLFSSNNSNFLLQLVWSIFGLYYAQQQIRFLPTCFQTWSPTGIPTGLATLHLLSFEQFLFLNYYFFLPNQNVFMWFWWYRVSEQQLWSQSSWDQIFAYPHATCLHLGKLISLSWFPHLQDGNICGKE